MSLKTDQNPETLYHKRQRKAANPHFKETEKQEVSHFSSKNGHND